MPNLHHSLSLVGCLNATLLRMKAANGAEHAYNAGLMLQGRKGWLPRSKTICWQGHAMPSERFRKFSRQGRHIYFHCWTALTPTNALVFIRQQWIGNKLADTIQNLVSIFGKPLNGARSHCPFQIIVIGRLKYRLLAITVCRPVSRLTNVFIFD